MLYEEYIIAFVFLTGGLLFGYSVGKNKGREIAFNKSKITDNEIKGWFVKTLNNHFDKILREQYIKTPIIEIPIEFFGEETEIV